MRQDREHPLYYLDAEILLVAIYVWVGHGVARSLLTSSRPYRLKASSSPKSKGTRKPPWPNS